MRFKTIIDVSMIILLSHVITFKSIAAETDHSLSDEAWIKLGIPAKIDRPEQYRAISQIFLKRSSEDKNVLPRYDSKKSGLTFKRIFNTQIIDSMASQRLPYEQIQKNLMAVHEELDLFPYPYMSTKSVDKEDFNDEIMRKGDYPMNMKAICPCPKLSCPNHGYCDKCTSRHVRLGFLNYCAFHTLLPTMKQVMEGAPESPTSQKLNDLIQAQLQAYDQLMDEHGLSQEGQNRLLKQIAEYSDH